MNSAGEGFVEWWASIGSKMPGASLQTQNVAELAWREGRCTLDREWLRRIAVESRPVGRDSNA